MNKHIIKHILTAACTTMLFSACKEEMLRGPIEKSKGAPGEISQVQIENRNGFANIIYQLPDNPDLAYVKAVYEVGRGTKREIKASYYTNRMTLDGFGDTLAHQVQLYAVNRGEEASKPVTITVQPLVSPITLTYRSMKVVATFGGINIQTTNQFRYPLVIMPLYDSTGKGAYSTLDNIYTEDSLINRNIRGLDTVATKFAISIRDRFLNHTDTMYATLKPIYEQQLDRLTYSAVHLANDAKFVYSTNQEMMWDGRGASQWPSAFTDESAGGPVSITMNLGKATILSRFKIFPYMEIGSNYYIRGNVRLFEVYGSNNPSPDGNWSSWTKLRDCEVIKPSGQPYGTETTGDQELATAGWEFDFPAGLPPYKYLRFKLLRTWQGHYGFSISQLKLWGASM
ncbi:DUF5000 domain-containing lipoprotein [Chitinophaga arvensicola]|uniref:F5/8 type C domain-containing protein n=1 Tax=Chitinophaga arvensicola TaxID=29529 RepID=A0A1I0RUC6_9BACT|nr:DUF5000 domain-containing lipoprotein [Chitinophaga arvensicola]SEW44397.1 protein of unknown function [Chitinophaga arvensicola]